PAACAAATGSRPLVDAPSDSSTIAAGGRFFPAPGARFNTPVAALIASPVAVPPDDDMRVIAALTAWRSSVGLCSTLGTWLNAITPTFTCLGTVARNWNPARLAAVRRLGC